MGQDFGFDDDPDGVGTTPPHHPGPSLITGHVVPDQVRGRRGYTLRLEGRLLGSVPDLVACMAAMQAAAAEQRALLGGRVRGRTVTIVLEEEIEGTDAEATGKPDDGPHPG
jgi:hypothetical protein